MNQKIPGKFPPPFDSGGKLCYNKKNADRVKAAKRKIGIWRAVRTGHSEPVRTTFVGISIEFQAAYRRTVRSILPFSGIHP